MTAPASGQHGACHGLLDPQIRIAPQQQPLGHPLVRWAHDLHMTDTLDAAAAVAEAALA